MNADDPRLTAHALGEADDESAETISSDPELLAEAAEIERLAAHLRAEFQSEPAHPLHEEQRETILAVARVVSGPAHWWQRTSVVGAAAACLIVALGLTVIFQARYVNRLQALAESAQAAPQSITVTLAGGGEARQQHIEPVVAPKASLAEAEPSYSAPPAVSATPAPPAVSEPPSAIARVDATPKPATLRSGASATPAIAKAPTTPSGIVPPDRPSMNASPLRPDNKAQRK